MVGLVPCSAKQPPSRARRIRLALLVVALLLAGWVLLRVACRLHPPPDLARASTGAHRSRVTRASYRLRAKAQSGSASGRSNRPHNAAAEQAGRAGSPFAISAAALAAWQEAADLTADFLLGSAGAASQPEAQAAIGVGQQQSFLQQSLPLAGEAASSQSSSGARRAAASSVQNLVTAGQATAARHPACALFDRQKGLSSVAVVGNGPLSPQQRQEIGAHGLVIRFNFVNNMWRSEERADVWAVRYSFDAERTRFWGFDQLPPPAAAALLARTQSMWLIVPESALWAAEDLRQVVPELAAHEPVVVTVPDQAEGELSPTTGFVGLQQALACAPASAVLHVYGMNWGASAKIWEGHDVAGEEAAVRAWVQAGRAVVHEPPCGNLRSCEQEELHVDCHLDAARRFVCPRPQAGRLAPDHASRVYASVAEVEAAIAADAAADAASDAALQAANLP